MPALDEPSRLQYAAAVLYVTVPCTRRLTAADGAFTTKPTGFGTRRGRQRRGLFRRHVPQCRTVQHESEGVLVRPSGKRLFVPNNGVSVMASLAFWPACWRSVQHAHRVERATRRTFSCWRLRTAAFMFRVLGGPSQLPPLVPAAHNEERGREGVSTPDVLLRGRHRGTEHERGLRMRYGIGGALVAFIVAATMNAASEASELDLWEQPSISATISTTYAEGGDLTHRSVYPDTVLEFHPPWQQQRYARWYETNRVLLEEARRMHHRDAAEAEDIQEMLERDDLVPLRSPPRSTETEGEANALSSPDATAKVNIWSVEKRAPPDSPDVIFWRRVGVTAFVGGFVWWSHVLSIRNSDRVRLPNTYDPGAIASYFVLRPERVATRSISIVCEAIRYFLGLQRDQLEYRLFGAKRSPQQRPEQIATTRADTRSVAAAGGSTGVSASRRAPSVHLKEYLRSFIGVMRVQLVRVGDMLITPLRKDDTYWVWRRQRRAVLLRQTLERLGPAFVKLGQALATRPDIIGEAAARELQRLQDDMPHFSNDEAFRFIRTELGAPPSRVFDWITENPVASASLGQVYKASLDGVDLAVKVQRPGIVERIALDFYVVRMLGELWMQSPWAPRTDLVEVIDEYASRLFEETDYGHEAENMRRFRQLYGSLPGVYVPEVYPEYSSAHVLTMEWVNGRRLIDETATVRRDDIPLIKLGILCSLMQLMETGFLHADPHTGNLLVTEDGSRLVYLDYGLMSEVPQSVQLSIICAVVHLINREYEQLASDFFGLTLMRRDDLDALLPEFAEALRQTFESEHDNRNPADFTLQGVAENLLRMTVRFPFVMPLYFLNNLRALAMLEGLALNADPSFRIMDIIYPYVVRRLLTDPSPQLQRALQELVLTPFGEPRWDRVEKLLDDAARTAPSMAMSSLDPRPVAVLEVAAQEAAEIARRRRTEQSDNEAQATMSAYFRQSPPEASLMTNSSLNGVVDGSLKAPETHDESLTENASLVTLDEQRRMQMMITFMASQAGVFLRRALERQLADDWNDRVQAFLDELEKRLLPGVLTAHEIPLDATVSQLDDECSDETEGMRADTADVEAAANGRKSTTELVRAGTEPTNGTEEWARSTNGLMTRRHRSGPRLTTATRENRRRLSQIITHLKLKHWRALLSLAPVLMVFYVRVFCAVAWRVLQRLGFDLGILVVLGWRALRTFRPLAILSKSRRATALQEAPPNGSLHGVAVDEASTETKFAGAEEEEAVMAVVDQRLHSTRNVNTSGNGHILNDHASLESKGPARHGQTKAVEDTHWAWQRHSPPSSAKWSSNGKVENGATKTSDRNQIK